MFSDIRRFSWCVGCLSLFATAAMAQDFRVYTRVTDESGMKPRIVARSLSLFHAGKVYDHIDEVGEVIIFDPSHRKFIILNSSQSIATTVHFDEIKNLLKLARTEMGAYITKLEKQDKSNETKLIAALGFQLAPKFIEQYEQRSHRLILTSPFLKYKARCAEAKSPEAVETYLRSADWLCRLNYVLHPHALLPEARLELNNSLRKRGMIPVEVELEAELDSRLHLKAEHQIRWELGTNGRKMINQWNTALESSNTRHVPFREYQRTMLVSQSRQAH